MIIVTLTRGTICGDWHKLSENNMISTRIIEATNRQIDDTHLHKKQGKSNANSGSCCDHGLRLVYNHFQPWSFH